MQESLKLEKIPGTNIYENRRIICRKKDEICKLENFFKDNIRNLETILKNFEENIDIRKKYTKEYGVVKSSIGDLRNAKGKNCSKIGDIIIALESPNGYILLSTDNFFEFLGGSLKKKFKILELNN